MKNLIILIGYRGVGKTCIGRKLADNLGYAFFDTDAEIEQITGENVSVLVERDGWQVFRSYEKEVLRSLKKRNDTVIATGGGAILHEKEWQDLTHCSNIFWLTAELDIIIKRIRNDAVINSSRPSLTGADIGDEVATVLQKRLPLYQKISHYTIDTGMLNIDDAAKLIELRLPRK